MNSAFENLSTQRTNSFEKVYVNIDTAMVCQNLSPQRFKININIKSCALSGREGQMRKYTNTDKHRGFLCVDRLLKVALERNVNKTQIFTIISIRCEVVQTDSIQLRSN